MTTPNSAQVGRSCCKGRWPWWLSDTPCFHCQCEGVTGTRPGAVTYVYFNWTTAQAFGEQARKGFAPVLVLLSGKCVCVGGGGSLRCPYFVLRLITNKIFHDFLSGSWRECNMQIGCRVTLVFCSYFPHVRARAHVCVYARTRASACVYLLMCLSMHVSVSHLLFFFIHSLLHLCVCVCVCVCVRVRVRGCVCVCVYVCVFSV